MPHSEDRFHWMDEIPSIDAIYERGGEPGKEYAYVTPPRVPKAQEAGYRQTAPVFFTLAGPGGESQFVVMERGDPVVGVRPESARPMVKVDDALTALLDAPAAPPSPAPQEPPAERRAAPRPAAEALYRLPCGAEKRGKRSANGHRLGCKDGKCVQSRSVGERLDRYRVAEAGA